jgi:hypothetical protein
LTVYAALAGEARVPPTKVVTSSVIRKRFKVSPSDLIGRLFTLALNKR